MAKVYVGLGTNLGDKEQNLKVAVQKIEEQIEIGRASCRERV